MTFLGAVNRVLRSAGILRGDDDEVTTFSDVQHNATLNLAIVAIQSELADLVSDRLISYEKTSSSIATVNGTRVYAVAADFVRFYGQNPFLYNATDNVAMYEYPGGVDTLRHQILDYQTQAGGPYYWYWEDTTSKKVGLFPVPTSAETWAYDYEKDVSVTASSDTLPFHNEMEAQALCDMATPHFKLLLTRQDTGALAQNASYMMAKSRLSGLLRSTDPSNRYGSVYR